jgi:hypothetical protein
LKPNGSPLDDTKEIAITLAKSGVVDLLNTSVGMHDSPVHSTASYVPRAAFASLTKSITSHLRQAGLTIPVVASHRINTAEAALKLLEDGACDLISLGRALLADPQFARKALDGKERAIAPCIACNNCFHKLLTNRWVSCAINPRCGNEVDPYPIPAVVKKSVAVVGAGPAGITCALTLSERGHDVTLFEKEEVIGGQLNLAKVIPGKEEYFMLLEYWVRRLRESKVKVLLNREFTEEDITMCHNNFHAVALCSGSFPRMPSSNHVPGFSESKIVVPFTRILDGSVKAGRRVAVVGFGPTAVDVASFLLHDPRITRSPEAYFRHWGVDVCNGTFDPGVMRRPPTNNRDVLLFTRASQGADLPKGKGWFLRQWLQNHGCTTFTSVQVDFLNEKGLHMTPMDGKKVDSFFVSSVDTVVYARGMLPNQSLMYSFQAWGCDGGLSRGQIASDFGVYPAGACRDAQSGEGHGEQDLQHAIHDGYEVGRKML